MVEIPATRWESEILQKVSGIERSLRESMERIERKLSAGEEPVSFFADALQLYRQKHIKLLADDKHRTAIDRLRERFSLDAELCYPHRKILDSLLSRFDFQSGKFFEAHFSELVRQARVGKNRAQGYLALLEAKGYVERRNDGYRHFFRIKA